MRRVDLKSRKEKILGTIVETYIGEAEPVGSRTIARKLHFKFSPATIRNIMADLEEEGYITHPYTSAGRVPTDKGYRYYVDHLMPEERLTPQEKKEIMREMEAGEDISEIMDKTSRLLARLCEEAGIVVYPCLKKSRLKHIELIDVGNNSVLMVLITNSGLIKNLLLRFPQTYSRSHLEKITNLFNAELEGVYLSEIWKYLWHKRLSDDFSVFNLFKDAFSILEEAFKKLEEERFSFEGATQILTQPEFEDRYTLTKLLQLIEERRLFLDILAQDMEEEGIKAHIGEENSYKEFRPLSLVTANYHIEGKVVGALGVVGPTRMAYAHVFSIVKNVSEILESVLERRL
ncbi:MAG: heat-inducible transcriptional repressor HrcA [Candidatus Omnitrophica bacterium]|nr:heat-inducible transcriptional repressor HrcA [Candidatus Omnitrophota bacterium]MCM8798019.1 heat-inducible transcriptional repressor HrcA [Candidatus Omnitrophota bacterium]